MFLARVFSIDASYLLSAGTLLCLAGRPESTARLLEGYPFVHGVLKVWMEEGISFLYRVARPIETAIGRRSSSTVMVYNVVSIIRCGQVVFGNSFYLDLQAICLEGLWL